MSALDIYTTTNDKQLNYYKRYRDNHQRVTTSLYNKWNTAKSTTSTSTHSHSYVTITSRGSSSSSSSSFELLFSKLLDALIFTSAIAITAYSFLTGTLIEPTRPNTITHAVVSNSGSSIPSKPRYESSSRYQRRRTQEWAEQQLLTSASFGVKKRSCSTSKVHHFNDFIRIHDDKQL